MKSSTKRIFRLEQHTKPPTMLFQNALKVIGYTIRIFAVILPVSFGVFWILNYLFYYMDYNNELLYWLTCILIIFGTYRFLWKQIVWFTGLKKFIELEN